MTQSSPFAASDFSAPPERSHWFADQVARRVSTDAELRVLDVGCGAGEHVLALAERMPRATLCGVDVSPANIEKAERARIASAAASRVSFSCADYLEYRAGVFDVVVGDSSLHLISHPTAALVQKIAADLAPQGLLIASLPNCGTYNRLLWALRRLLSAIRSKWLDEVALAISLRIYRGRYDEAFLRQRIPYLYLLPHRCEGAVLRDAARASGLEWLTSERAPHDNVLQPVHVLATFRRAAK